MMKKCKNCKHFKAMTHTIRSIDRVKVINYCDPDNTMRMEGMTWIFDKTNLFECPPKDKEHNCESYKRKWWKFWIKDDEDIPDQSGAYPDPEDPNKRPIGAQSK